VRVIVKVLLDRCQKGQVVNILIDKSPENEVLWASCQVLYIAIPLVVYVLFFTLILPDKDWNYLACKPQWMLIAVMYYAEALRDTIELHSNKRSIRVGLRESDLILSLLLLLASSLILFAVIGHYEEVFPSCRNLLTFQWLSITFGLASCWYAK
jgi:hypothetical protein